VPLARSVGFSPIVVEDLEELGDRARFPDAVEVIDSFDVRDWKQVPLDDRTYAVIVTRDHATDQALLEQLIGYDLAYLGLIGSRRKIELFKQRLEHKGFDPARFARLHAPIGLDIGAQTPEEIAVAIVAELIQVRAARRPRDRSAAPKGCADGAAGGLEPSQGSKLK
jgi:xanthine dehydrogenase accessory factor